MSEGPITESDLQAYADGRLEPERRVAVEAWLATRPEEAERIADYRKITKELRGI
jgi:anti-sigma factor RsiW